MEHGPGPRVRLTRELSMEHAPASSVVVFDPAFAAVGTPGSYELTWPPPGRASVAQLSPRLALDLGEIAGSSDQARARDAVGR
jgi:hypothetical protein